MNQNNLLYYPLNGQEILAINPGAKLITYDRLNNVFDIEDLFKNTDKLIILYLLRSRNEGHWVCLFKNEQGFNFFDSYGKLPDFQVDCLTPLERADFNEKKGRLKHLLRNYDVYYNDYKFQQKGTMVCGCFVSHRLNNYLMTDEEYTEELKKIYDPEKFVAEYCLRKLKKVGKA